MLHAKRLVHDQHGSILLPAMFILVVLSVVGAVALNTMQSKYRLAYQTASWQEALLSAEAGVEVGMNEVRKIVFDKPEVTTDDPFQATNGWIAYPAEFQDLNNNGEYDGPSSGEAWVDHNQNGVPDLLPGWSFTSSLLHRDTEGGSDSRYNVIIDKPIIHPTNNEPYYRVRAWGQMDVPGGGVTAGENKDNWLRKLSLQKDHRTKQAVERPYARRYIETVLKPVTAFRLALFGVSSINLNNENILVDSWKSSDTVKYPGGLYPSEANPNISASELARLRNQNGDIATNGKVIEAGRAHVYGDAATNGGTEGEYGVLNADNVTGEITNDFEQEVFDVRVPQVAATNVGAINSEMVLQATSGGVVTYSTTGINLSGQKELRLKGELNADGTPKETYIQVIVNGNFSLSGQAQVTLDPGVYVRFFVTGNADITGNGFQNPNNALNLQLYGVDTLPDGTPRGNEDASVGLIKIAGNGGFKGAVYAPRYDVEMKGGGNSDNIFGSFTGRNISMTGIQQVHYDESMADGGLVVDYKIASWYEDVR